MKGAGDTILTQSGRISAFSDVVISAKKQGQDGGINYELSGGWLLGLTAGLTGREGSTEEVSFNGSGGRRHEDGEGKIFLDRRKNKCKG